MFRLASFLSKEGLCSCLHNNFVANASLSFVSRRRQISSKPLAKTSKTERHPPKDTGNNFSENIENVAQFGTQDPEMEVVQQCFLRRQTLKCYV